MQHVHSAAPERRRGSTLIRRLHRLAAAALLCGAALQPVPAAAETLRAGGTGAALGTMRVLAEAMKKRDPHFTLELLPNLGSGGGMKALDRGVIHFALISRPLSADEMAKGMQAMEYARTPFVIATARKGVGSMTLAQLADIYSAKQTTWLDGSPVRLVLRPANDGDTALLASFSPAVKEALARAMTREGMVMGVTDQDSADEIARLPGGLGTSSLALILSERRPLHVVPIDGVTPSVRTLADGTYPYAKSLFMVTRSTAPEAVQRFVSFIRSAEGRTILADTGHVAMDAKPGAKAAGR